jgi:hypothetical protein
MEGNQFVGFGKFHYRASSWLAAPQKAEFRVIDPQLSSFDCGIIASKQERLHVPMRKFSPDPSC